MASLLIPNSASLTLTLTHTLALPSTPARASFKPTHVPTPLVFRRTRGLTVVTRAGPSTSTYVFAFVLPLSLLAVTIFTSIRIADKLDRDFLEENLLPRYGLHISFVAILLYAATITLMSQDSFFFLATLSTARVLAINQAIRGEDEEDQDENEDEEISVEEVQEPVLSRTRNRPKREV